MLQINSDDSDCIIQDSEITCISLEDSQDGEKVVHEDSEIPPAPAFVATTSMEQDMEEGEVSDMDEETSDDDICEITFNNQNKFKKFSKIIIDNIKDKLNDTVDGKKIKILTKENKESVTVTVMYLNPDGIEDIPKLPSIKTSSPIKEKQECFEKESSPDLSGLSELFMIDTEPASKVDSVQIPSYKRAVKDALLDEEAAAFKKQKHDEDLCKKVKTNSCFNCGDSGHSIRDCQKPHNSKRIKNARRMCYKAERYHVDVEQRFAHIKPGCVSDKLREAMGLRKGELPFFFYRMRVLGYPPGWLEDAKVEQSGITLFNSDGTKILHSDEDEGELDESSHKYNISKIVDFPGFNQDPGENFFDDYKYHQVPPLDKKQLKEEFVKTLGDTVLKAYKRKKLKDFPNANNNDSLNDSSIHESTDMDIEDPESTTVGIVEFTRPQPPPETDFEVKPPPPPTTPPPHPNHNTSQSVLLTPSPSLIELVKQKRRLLQELKAETSVIEIEDSLIDDIICLDEECSENESNKSKNPSPTDINNSDKQSNTNTNSDNISSDIIKESFMGTPVLKFSPYDNLPKGDNFKVGVSDVINFENLPDSTGKYEQMKEVIKKVRNVLHKIQSED